MHVYIRIQSFPTPGIGSHKALCHLAISNPQTIYHGVFLILLSLSSEALHNCLCTVVPISYRIVCMFVGLLVVSDGISNPVVL